MDVLSFTLNIIAAAFRAGTPLLIVTLGEIITERSGVMNLGLEGMMLMGAYSGFAAAMASDNVWVGMCVAILVGGLMALLHAIVTISLRANQVVSGLALTILGTGLSTFLGPNLVGVYGPSFTALRIPLLADIPVIGEVFFNHDLPVYLAILLVPLVWVWLNKTRPGLNMRLVGENPAAADTLGINVTRVRYIYVVVGGMLSGLAGASLSLSYTPGWKDFMTAGRGWIAIGLVIFAMWNPIRAAFGAFFFGAISGLQFGIQITGIKISVFFLQMMPYIFTLLVLGLASRNAVKKRIAMPEALGVAYERGERGL